MYPGKNNNKNRLELISPPISEISAMTVFHKSTDNPFDVIHFCTSFDNG